MTDDVTLVRIDIVWDDEARVWIATSPDVKGLVLEDGSLDRLMYRVPEAVPELIELNDQEKCSGYVIHAERRQAVWA